MGGGGRRGICELCFVEWGMMLGLGAFKCLVVVSERVSEVLGLGVLGVRVW